MTGQRAEDEGNAPGEPGGRLSGSTRVEAFSDAVFAIAITLLVLDLHAPTGGDMLHHLLQQWPAYLAYLASFGYIGVIWVNHHQLFTRIASVDLGLLWCNLGLLLGSSVLPFPTAVLSSAFRNGSRSNEVTGSILYVVIAAVMALAWLVLFHYLATHERLLERQTPASFFAGERSRALLGVIAYLVAAPVALWQPLASLVIICVLPVFYGATSEGFGRARKPGLPGRWP
ncbi:MAG TPA: TMEM175 family protein [Streptosporangiaceae bacterium]|nr:TMEM175 family protein [Streptosporangiaceae bacterium]